jgi:hypothetical protein
MKTLPVCLLKGNAPLGVHTPEKARGRLALILAFAIATVSAHGSPIKSGDVDRIADAIFRCENSRTHPYGVMIPTKHPRTVCENTIRHAWVDFERQQKKLGTGSLPSSPKRGVVNSDAYSLPFIQFLSRRYAPIGAKNDPTHLNENWARNVEWFLRHEK